MNGNRKAAWLGLMMVAAGACRFVDLSATAAETPGSSASAAKPAAEHARAPGNLLRNAGFELDSDFNGSPMRQGTEFMRAVALFQKRCPPPPCEGWWIDGGPGDGVSLESKEVHCGSRAIRLEPPEGKRVSLVSAPEVPVPAGPLVLSAWVRTTSAKALLDLQLVAAGARSNQDPHALRSLSRRQIALPENAAQWSRVTISTDAPAEAAAVVRLVVERGCVVADDLQLETGRVAKPFGVRPEERIGLAFEGTPESRLPFWMAEDDTPRKLLVRNGSDATIDGDLEIWVGPWSRPKSERLAARKNISLKAGDADTIPLRLGHLKPDAYVVAALLARDGKPLLDGSQTVDPSIPIGGSVSGSILKSRAAIRFALGPKVRPAGIFGVGDGTLVCGWRGLTGSWFGGWPLAQFAAARPEGFVCGRGSCSNDDKAYLFAAAGVPFHRMESQRLEYGAPAGAPFEVPGEKGGIDLWNPQGMAVVKANAAEVGRSNAQNPLIVSYQMDNEHRFPFSCGLCPTAAADASFRQWCRKRHGELATLNRRWGTAYKSWDEVEQPASARYAEEIMKRPKAEGAAANDWTASLGKLTPEIQRRMLAIPGRGMDWMRWRTASSLWAYDAFRDSARVFDRKTLYSTNLCWPNFAPQMSMPFFRHMDATMLDVQYTAGSGLPRGLGTPMQMMEILEMAESNAPEKPLWGIEIYVQPQWPAEFAALQNWGLLAHGMQNTLVFGWGPNSDYGIPKEPRAWEKPDAKPMWMMIDLDGKKLPNYFTNRRSLREIAQFHKRYDGLSLRRAPTDTAFFVSRDTAEYGGLESANRPWLSPWVCTRSDLCYLLRLSGIKADFVDDETLPAGPGRFRTVIVPAAYVLSQETAAKLARFARDGGTLVLAGASGVVDPWLSKYPNLGGPAWAELGWTATKFLADPAEVDFQLADTAAAKADRDKRFWGSNIGTMPGGQPIHDGRGNLLGWTRAWGKGKLVAYGVLPAALTGNPHPSPDETAWIEQLVRAAGLRAGGRWASSQASRNRSDKLGEGEPIVDVVVRVRKGRQPQEKIVFVLNQGGAGSGLVEVPIGKGVWQATDALGGKPLEDAHFSEGMWRLNLALKPWEYRVFHLAQKGG
jgi:hypothetical protein